ncbi:MAG: penicillin-binding protein 1C [Deltaproteobacteria bacterium]
MRHVGRILLSGILLGTLFGAALVVARLWPQTAFDREDLRVRPNCVFTDRDGNLLRILPDDRGERRLWIPGKEIPAAVKDAFIAAEDKRFRAHRGFDPLAILRAVADNLRHGRIVSGASTISQQVARLVYPRERSYEGKIIEILRARRMEEVLSKEEILEQYLNRVPLGNNIRGVELAARTYFGKSARHLTVPEAALLAALPKAPGRLDPYGPRRDELLVRMEGVLARMARMGSLSAGEAARGAGRSSIDFRPFSSPFGAPHAVDLLIARGVRGPGFHRTTIDSGLQSAVERIAASQRARLARRKVRQAAVIVVHNPTMEVLASAGSLAYGPGDGGFNNGTVSRRSAGSTLKPLLYATALEAGATASSLVNDTMQMYRTPMGDYSPDNFDGREYGPVTVRVALANSLNISAVRTVEALSRARFERFLEASRLIRPSAAGQNDYGLGLAVGNAEVRLEDLVAAYAMLANGGLHRPLRYLRGDGRPPPPKRLLSEEAAFVVSDILADPSARMIAFRAANDLDIPFRVSIKTGTSTFYRDGWIVGYTPEYTVGVWTGNFDGSPSAGSTGAWAAAPIFRQVMEVLHGHAPPPVPVPPPGVESLPVCGISGMKAGPTCPHVTRELFVAGTAPGRECDFHANGGEFHRIPVAYAGWLARKNRAGAAGRYRLRGFSDRLETVFEDENDLPPSDGQAGIRIRNPEGPAVSPSPPRDPETSGDRRHSIGSVASATADLAAGLQSAISILYPLPRDRFLKNASNAFDEIRLDAVPSDPVPYVDWFVDGRHLARVGPPYSAAWKPERGKHRITAATSGNVAERVEIEVE